MVARRLKYCVNNEWRESKTAKYMPVTNSSTGEVMAEAPCCTVEEVNGAVAAAAAAFPGWSSTPIQDRTAVMFRFRSLLESHLEELTLSVSTELGKNLEEARGDIIKAMEVVEMACGAPILMQGDALMNVSTGHDTVMYRE
ncbi:MAG: aldehyde dehydrogenase family protein, partial [Proteobacteria bacterium]|nr:aldehyde dehydrogenase family protein [Pseudomonadota bacterium]